MKNYKKHIDDFFREKLGRYRETPPADVWDGLEGRLDTLKPFVPKSPFRWVWHFGMVSLITVLSVSLTRKFINKPAATVPTEVAVTVPTTPATAEQSTAAAPAAQGESAQQPAATANNESNTSAAGAQNTQQGTTVPTAAVATSNNKPSIKDDKNNGTHSDSKPPAIAEDRANAATRTVKSAKGKAAQQQLAYASAPGAQAKNKPGHNATSNNKEENAGSKKPGNFFSGSRTMAQLSATEDNLPDNGSLSGVVARDEHPAEASNSLASAPVKTATKETVAQPAKKPAEKIADKKTDKPAVKRFDFGVKAGYEMGLSSPSATKWVVAPYLQYHVAPKVAIMLQPGIKYATIAQRNAGKAQTYYSINQDGNVAQNGAPVIDSIKVISTNVDTYYHTNYRYTQSHDSISKTRTYGGSYTEFELPLLLQYSVSKQLSVYGGVNLVYSRRMVVTENTYIQKGIQRSLDSTVYGAGSPVNTTPPQMSNVFTYTGSSYSEYPGSVYPMKQENMVRVGYMLGLSYEYSQRWLFDALIQHSPLKPDVKDGYNLNSSLSSPYFRLSVGYKLTK